MTPRFESDRLFYENPFGLEMVRIPGGEFLMGSDPAKDTWAQADEQPQHRVHVSEYYISKYPVTGAQFNAFAKAQGRGYGFTADGLEHPATNVSWEAATAFCEWLSEATGAAFRLPTEAEWEKAARGADGRMFPWGNEWSKDNANTRENAPLIFFSPSPSPVTQYSPAGDSPYGVSDMSGNVWEWVADWHGPDEYRRRAAGEVRDPRGPAQGMNKVLRGGACDHMAHYARAAFRNGNRPNMRKRFYGFRLALTLG